MTTYYTLLFFFIEKDNANNVLLIYVTIKIRQLESRWKNKIVGFQHKRVIFQPFFYPKNTEKTI